MQWENLIGWDTEMEGITNEKASVIVYSVYTSLVKVMDVLCEPKCVAGCITANSLSG